MKTDKKRVLMILAGIAFALLAILQINSIIIVIVNTKKTQESYLTYYVFNLINHILLLIGYAVISFSCFKSNSKLLLTGLFWISSVATQIVSLIYSLSNEIVQDINISLELADILLNVLKILVYSVPLICAIVFLGLYGFSKLNESKSDSGNTMNLNGNQTSIDTNDTIDRLEKLMALQSIGAITEDEFEAKKKQLLGL